MERAHKMLYPLMTLDDGTEIVHSEPLMVDGRENVLGQMIQNEI